MTTTARVAAADIGGTWLRVQIFSRAGAAMSSVVRRRWSGSPTPRLLARELTDLLNEVAAPRAIPLHVALAAQMDAARDRVLVAPNLGWHDVDLRAQLRAELRDVVGDVLLVNDVEAAAVGELGAGRLRGKRNALMVLVGTGVGGALIADGRVLRGDFGRAGEIGHARLAGREEPCGCGARGCVEAIVGGAALRRRIPSRFPELDAESGLAPLLARASGGDARASAFVDDLSLSLARVLAPVLSVLDASTLVLGGGVLEHAPAWRPWIDQALRPLLRESLRETLVLCEPMLEERAALVGAALLSAR